MGFPVFLYCDERKPDVIKNPIIVDTVNKLSIYPPKEEEKLIYNRELRSLPPVHVVVPVPRFQPMLSIPSQNSKIQAHRT